MTQLSTIFNEIALAIRRKGIDFTGSPTDFANVISSQLEINSIHDVTLFTTADGIHTHRTYSDTLSIDHQTCYFGEDVPNATITMISGDDGSPLTASQTSAFMNATALEHVYLPNLNRVQTKMFQSCSKLKTCHVDNAISLDGNCLNNCISLQDLKIDNVRNINGGALTGCRSLSAVDLPNVTAIGNSAFWQCASLSTLYIPKLKTLDTSIFALCYNLSTVSVAADNDYADCMDDDGNISKSGNVIIDKKNKSIKWVSIPVTRHLVVPNEVSSIGPRCCHGCKNLTWVDCGNANYIGNVAFYECTNLVSVILSADYSKFSPNYPILGGSDVFTTNLTTKKPDDKLSIFMSQDTYDAIQSKPNWIDTILAHVKIIP